MELEEYKAVMTNHGFFIVSAGEVQQLLARNR